MQDAYQENKRANETAPLLMEFIARKRLAELGFMFDPSDLSIFKAECFQLISTEIQKLEAEEMERAR